MNLETPPSNSCQRPCNRGDFCHVVFPIQSPERQPGCEYGDHFFTTVDVFVQRTPLKRCDGPGTGWGGGRRQILVLMEQKK